MDVSLAVRPCPSRREADEARRFEAIYREHFASVDAHARRRLAARADDVVAETFSSPGVVSTTSRPMRCPGCTASRDGRPPGHAASGLTRDFDP